MAREACGQARGRDRCPCEVRREVEKMAACGQAAEGNGDLYGLLMGIQTAQLPTKQPNNHPTLGSLWESRLSAFTLVQRTDADWLVSILVGAWFQNAVGQATQASILEVRCLPNPQDVLDQRKFGLSREESGYDHPHGPRIPSSSEGSSSRQTLSERK